MREFFPLALARRLLRRRAVEEVSVPRVLVVDADEDVRRLLSVGLPLEGFTVAFARSAAGALDALAAPPRVDVALIDLMMPEVNGLALARLVRRSYPDVRVVLMSAYHLSARQVERTDCGAVGFVPKPFRLTELSSFLRAKSRPLQHTGT